MAMGDMTKIQIFVVSGHDFQTTTSIRRSKFAFSCIIQPILSENEKRNASTMFLTHIFAFKVAISLFALKGPKFGPQYLGNELGFLEKNLPGAKYHVIQYKITENKENLKTSLPGFACISQKMALKCNFQINYARIYHQFLPVQRYSKVGRKQLLIWNFQCPISWEILVQIK